MSYSILHCEKIKDRSKATTCARHNLRIGAVGSNVSPDKSHFNKILVNKFKVDVKKGDSLQKAVSEHYESLKIKEREDNVFMMEFFLSASPEFFEGKTNEEILEWADYQTQFMQVNFPDQIALATLHVDEKSPHLHFLVTTEEKRERKFKNRYGEGTKETWALNANRFNPAFLKELQNRIGAWNKRLGLKRGKVDSKAEHVPLKAYQEGIGRLQKKLDKANNSLKTYKDAYPKLKDSFLALMELTKHIFAILDSKNISEEEEERIEGAISKTEKTGLKIEKSGVRAKRLQKPRASQEVSK